VAGVSRESVNAVAERFGVPAAAPGIARLLGALEAEPDPPTTVREPARALDEHVADSLAGLEVEALRSARLVADLGAGAGFPGLALALALPDTRVDLIESGRRKAEVIGRLAAACGAANARAVALRAEEWGAGEGRGIYDAVTARALAPLAVLAEYAAPLLGDGGVLVAWKGARDEEEERAGAVAAHELGLSPVTVLPVEPFAGVRHRHLHVLEKVMATPDGFPRRPGMARKRPLG
jgi:16S rRNA (guanine527-N7)-methyltransferase